MKLIDRDHPFFAKAWVRWAAVLFPALWACVELYHDSPGWAAIFGGLAALALWELILRKT